VVADVGWAQHTGSVGRCSPSIPRLADHVGAINATSVDGYASPALAEQRPRGSGPKMALETTTGMDVQFYWNRSGFSPFKKEGAILAIAFSTRARTRS
jgi:hypothetical protein